ncbi:hypothetical protein Tco_0178548 [Tanacetum coccineum]
MGSRATLLDNIVGNPSRLCTGVFGETQKNAKETKSSELFTALADVPASVRSKCENKGIVPTEMELVLEYTQQGASHEVSNHKLIADIEDDIMDPVMQCTTLPKPYSEFLLKELVSFLSQRLNMRSTDSLTPSIHYEDGNPARAYIKTTLRLVAVWDVHLMFSLSSLITTVYHTSIHGLPFEALMEENLGHTVLWLEIWGSSLIGNPNWCRKMTDKVWLYKEKLQAARYRQ